MGQIRSINDLEGAVGKKPPALDLKVIDHIDALALEVLSHSSCLFACTRVDGCTKPVIAGGKPGFLSSDGPKFSVPIANCDILPPIQKGAPIGALCLVSGLGETLRINGHVVDLNDSVLTIEVGECYLHCAKALIRSGFWQAEPSDDLHTDKETFLSESAFMALGTIDAAGNADLSPKGDPAGSLAQWVDGGIRFADRPGNRRTDSFRNILIDRHVSAIFVIPGKCQVLTISGEAHLSNDEQQLAPFVVDGKRPKLVTTLSNLEASLAFSPALERADLWPAAPPPAHIRPARIFTAHMKLSKQRGLSASVARTVVSVPGMLERSLKNDYKNNLY